MSLRSALIVSAILASAFSWVTAGAQSSRLTMLDFSTGSEYEDYLRVMQVAGKVPLYPWSIRGFSQAEILRLTTADSTGPWRLRERFTPRRISAGPIVGAATFNSAYPYGSNDGAVWTGRGLTTAISAGLDGRLGPLAIQIAPIAFRAANRPFDLLVDSLSGAQAFNHGTWSRFVDFPQRFGKGAYSRIDPGQSDIRLDTRFVSAGLSTANEWIGPATEYPFLLGTNAAGFPHLFIRTGDPVSIWLGRIGARVMWGRLDQSAYSPVTGSTRFLSIADPGTIRLAATAEGIFLPRGIPGLEIGVARFIHVPYAVSQPNTSFWKKPFKVFFTKNEYAQGDTAGFDNQLASIFFRWVLPNSGFEIFGERGYEDQFYDFREFLGNPDHEREYMLGIQKILASEGDRVDALRVEIINYQTSALAQIRLESGIYIHTILRQGHTNRGQLLGAYPGVGAAAAGTISWSRYSPSARTAFTLRRLVKDERGEFYKTGSLDRRSNDVLLAGSFERMRFGLHTDFGARAEIMEELNRNFSRDAANLSLVLIGRFHL